MKPNSLVIGGAKGIGARLFDCLIDGGYPASFTTRETFDLRKANYYWPPSDLKVLFWVAAETKFIECERNPDAFTINARAPAVVAGRLNPQNQRFIFVSSEAAPYSAAYGRFKAAVEIPLLCGPVNAAVAILSKVTQATMDDCCTFLIDLIDRPKGFYFWPE